MGQPLALVEAHKGVGESLATPEFSDMSRRGLDTGNVAVDNVLEETRLFSYGSTTHIFFKESEVPDCRVVLQ